MKISWMTGTGGYAVQQHFQGQGHAVALGQSSAANGVDVSDAYKVFISQQGQELKEKDKELSDKEFEDILVPAENELRKLGRKDAEVQDKKEQIEAIDELLKHDELLTDKDRFILLRDRARLLKESETYQDKLYKLWAGKDAVMADLETGKITSAEALQPLQYYAEAIRDMQTQMAEEEQRRMQLLLDANQQRSQRIAEILAKAMRGNDRNHDKNPAFHLLGQKADVKEAQNALNRVNSVQRNQRLTPWMRLRTA